MSPAGCASAFMIIVCSEDAINGIFQDIACDWRQAICPASEFVDIDSTLPLL
jgi:hypothetical protein